MAMVRQLTEGEITNGNTPENDTHSSDHLDKSNSRPPSQSSSGSKRNSPAFMPSLQYTKEDLVKYSSHPLSQNWPKCLDAAYNNSTGKWDPERWFMNHRCDRILTLEESRSKRERQDDGLLNHKRKSSDPKERIKEEKDDIVLSPQRRSFGTGCHVIQQSSLARRPGSPSDGRDSENYRDGSRRIGSGRILARDPRDWDRDRDYGYSSSRNQRDRFDQDDDKDLRRYSSRYNRDRRTRGRDRIDEVEPEWFSGGPTSQSETIELVGFEEPHHDDDNRKPIKKGAAKRAKQNSRRSSLKSEEGEKTDIVSAEENSATKKGVLPREDSKPKPEKKTTDTEQVQEMKSTNAGFDFDDMIHMDWVTELLPAESPPDNANDLGCSRFRQFFQQGNQDSGNQDSVHNSRRSSFQEDMLANVLNSIGIPSPTPNPSENLFAPISPDHQNSVPPNKDILKILQTANAETAINGEIARDSTKSCRELEAGLKRMVLGDQKQPEERSAFDKLLQQMSDTREATSLSIGPLDKSKVLQEQDLLHDMLPSVSPRMHSFHMFNEDKGEPGIARVPYFQPPQSDLYAHLLQQKQQEQQHLQQKQQEQQHLHQKQQEQQHLHQMQQQMQSHVQPQCQNVQGFTVDMLAKILGTSTQPPLSPAASGLQQAASLNRGDPQAMNNVLQYQRQRELLSSILKQQQQSTQNMSQGNLLQPMPQQRRCPSAKDIPIQQTLGLPTLGLSPRQSPLPPESMGSVIPSQGRIPSPLVFGQQPPALSHAPAPIHPGAFPQAANSNTLQVQNALIKRKLEEQKENFRKRTTSPIAPNKNGMSSSPIKGISPTLAFTPSSVIRKLQSEKAENKEQKPIAQQSNKCGVLESRPPDNKMAQKISMCMSTAGTECAFVTANNHAPSQNILLGQGHRTIQGQTAHQPRPIHAGISSVATPVVIPGQGRPIVKVGFNSTNDLARGALPNKPVVTHNKPFVSSANQAHNIHEVETNFDMLSKLPWQHQHQFGPRQPTASVIPQLHNAAYALGGHRPPTVNTHHSSLLRPVNVASAGSMQASNMNLPYLRNIIQNPIRPSTSPIGPLQLAALQMRGSMDARQLQALAQSQRIHPAALQLLMNAQNQAAAAGNRDAKHQHLMPGHPTTNRQSPVNLTKWFGNDVLKQKMPEMPPVSHQNALHVEELERQQQSTVVHN